MSSDDEVKALRPPTLLEVLDNRCVAVPLINCWVVHILTSTGSCERSEREMATIMSEMATMAQPSASWGVGSAEGSDITQTVGQRHSASYRDEPPPSPAGAPPLGSCVLQSHPTNPPPHPLSHTLRVQGADGWDEIKPDSHPVRGEDGGQGGSA